MKKASRAKMDKMICIRIEQSLHKILKKSNINISHSCRVFLHSLASEAVESKLSDSQKNVLKLKQ